MSLKTRGCPRIIHQMWLDRYKKDNKGPPSEYGKYTTYTKSWQHHHPDYEYMFWNRDKVDELFNDPRLKKWKHFFQNDIVRHIEKCDFARYAVLYIYGGIYVDLDFECLRNIDDLLDKHDLGLSYEPSEHIIASPLKKIPVNNAIMFSKKGHPIWPQLMDSIMEEYKESNPVLVNTGPAHVAKFMEQHPEYPLIDTCLLNPMTKWGYLSKHCPTDTMSKAYAVTYWNEGTMWGGEWFYMILPYVGIGFLILIAIVIWWMRH